MPTAYIALGANLPSPAGEPEATLAAAVASLAALGRVLACSRLYSTAPVGMAEQPRFLNAAVALETDLAPRALLEGLLEMEREFGRDRLAGVENGPRTLDLDILLYGDLVLGEHGLAIPHPRMTERAFVLAPLRDIAAEVRDPRSQVTVAKLFERVLGEDRSKHVNKDVNDAFVQVESDGWRAGAWDTGGSGGAGVRAGAGARFEPGTDTGTDTSTDTDSDSSAGPDPDSGHD
jgi:2-amino-4-hydroxy-6-hydroxymethyldihydropteridine diphosphokinase